MTTFAKAHPATQAMSAARAPVDLNDGDTRRNPGEPSAEQAEASSYNKPKIQWHGLTICVENPAGSVRRGRNRHGVTWEVRMRFDYGEVLGTMGVDGDPVDVIVGPNMEAPMVYVVHQRRVNDWAAYDEDKCCIGFDSQSDAEQAFLSNYNDPRFLGPVTAMPVAEFVAKVRATKDKPAMIKAVAPVVLFFKAHVGAYLRGGKMVNLSGYQGRQARAVAMPGQMSLFGSNEHVSTPRAEMIAEHERLVDVLNSPSHEDDKVEAKRQEKELAEYKQEAAAPDHLLADMPGAKWRRGKGRIAGHYGVEVDGEGVGNYHAKPEDAVAEARQWLSSRADHAKRAAEQDAAVGKLRERLLAGGEVTDVDLKLLGLRDGSSGLEWFIPAAAKVFGISSRAVRPHIADMIRIGHTDMGATKEFVSPKKALQAMAASIKPNADYNAAVTSSKQGPEDDDARRKFYVTVAREGRGVGKLAGPFDTHDEAKAHVSMAREEAHKVDPRSVFDAFGTAGVVADDHKPGVLNERLGIGQPYKPVTDESHPAPMPRSLMSGIPEERRDEWKDLHRQQHELHHYELGQVREKMGRVRSKMRAAEGPMREMERAANDMRASGMPGSIERADAAQAAADKHRAEFDRHRGDLDKLAGTHQSLYEQVSKLGRAKDKILDGSGDMDRDFASMAKRSAPDQAEHEKSMLKMYRQHYKDMDAARKRKPEPMTKAIVFLRRPAS